jgi:long-chain acyl-CoA synthetase
MRSSRASSSASRASVWTRSAGGRCSFDGAAHAALVLRSEVGEEELQAHCRALIADYKVPKSFEYHDELPKSGAGKVLKRELRRRHWAEREGFVG